MLASKRSDRRFFTSRRAWSVQARGMPICRPVAGAAPHQAAGAPR